MRNNAIINAMLITLLLLTFCSVMPGYAVLSWNIQQVKEYVWAGGDCPIAVDQKNITHVAYLDGYSLIYASYNDSTWMNQTIATDAIYLIFNLVLDTNGYPHLLYEEKGSGPLLIVNWNGKAWDTQNTGVAYTDFATLAVDSFGNPHIVYTTSSIGIINHEDWSKNTINTSLKYARWTGKSWNTQIVDTVMNDSLSSISLALGKNSVPHILYTPTSNPSNIKLATSQNSNWKIQTAELPTSTRNCGNIIVDSKGYSHFICTQPDQDSTTLSTILYACFNTTTWNTQTIASKVNLGTIGRLVFDSNDNPHFTYSTSDGDTTYVAYSGNTWEIQPLPPNIEVGDLALDPKNNPRLLFRTYSPARFCSHLMYATATQTTRTSPPPADEFTNSMVTSVSIIVLVFVASAALLRYFKKRKH